MTLGQAISRARKTKGLTQKQLASKVLKEDGNSISLPYVVDIEHDKRTPNSEHLIGQFAKALDIPAEYLYLLVGRLPSELQKSFKPSSTPGNDYAKAVKAYKAFRKELRAASAPTLPFESKG
jgi:transcriptional regulator with XRE-family HTH domain